MRRIPTHSHRSLSCASQARPSSPAQPPGTSTTTKMGCAGDDAGRLPHGDGRAELLVDDLPQAAGRRTRRGLRVRDVPRLVGLVPARTVDLGRGPHQRNADSRRAATASSSRSSTTSQLPLCQDGVRRRIHHQCQRPVQRLIVVDDGPLPDANIGQAYTAPALTASGGTVSSWSLAGGTLPAGPDPRLERRHLGDADAERHLRVHRAGERLTEQRHEAALDLRARTARAAVR